MFHWTKIYQTHDSFFFYNKRLIFVSHICASILKERVLYMGEILQDRKSEHFVSEHVVGAFLWSGSLSSALQEFTGQGNSTHIIEREDQDRRWNEKRDVLNTFWQIFG